MITIIIKRTDEPKVIQMTQTDLVKQLGDIEGAEIILVDRWMDGLKQVRTPYVSLVEPDCVLSSNYYSSNVGLMAKLSSKGMGGGFNRLAMIASTLGVGRFDKPIYNYELDKVTYSELNKIKLKDWQVRPCRVKKSLELYPVQVGFVPGAILRYASVKPLIDTINWGSTNLVELSTELSFHFWRTGRSLKLNPNTTYVSSAKYLDNPPYFKLPDIQMSAYTEAAELFAMYRKR